MGGKDPIGPDHQRIGVIIQMLGSNGRTSGRGPAADSEAVLGPPEVVGPSLTARVEQRNHGTGLPGSVAAVRSLLDRLQRGQLSQRFDSSSVPPHASGI